MARKSKKGKVTIAQAKTHYAEKVPVMPANYRSGMARFFGQDVTNSLPSKHYAEKIVSGVENTWESQLKKAFGIG